MSTEVLVCGGGVAGVMAAVSAGRRGVKVVLCERGGCLGGTLTASLVGFFLDSAYKGGLLGEVINLLNHEQQENGAMLMEAEKYLFEKLCREAGVTVLYYTQVCRVTIENRRIRTVHTHTPGGELDIIPEMVIDATGNGDVSAMAGCGFELGNDRGQTQPMSVIGIVTGIGDDAADYLGFGNRFRFKEYLSQIGIEPSLGFPNLNKLGSGLFVLSVNHEYGIGFNDTEKISEALIHGRRELYETVQALRQSGGIFANIVLVSTPELIGIREGRRIHGEYSVTLDDVIAGRTHDDAVCRVKYWIDIHALTGEGNRSYFGDDIACKPYDIPFRAQIPKDADNLILAGRCISGDFYAHASYRVAGNMACTGEAAGIMAARCIQEVKPLRTLRYVREW